MALIGIAIAIGIPIVNEQVRMAEIRAVADDLALHLRAARMIAVTKHTTITFAIDVDPINQFRYERKRRREKADQDARTACGSRRRPTPSINFKRNGSVDAASSIILESDVSGARERWTANVSTVGLTTLAHERVN